MSGLTAADRAAMDQNRMGARANLDEIVVLLRQVLASGGDPDVALQDLVVYIDGLHPHAVGGLLATAIFELASQR